MVVTEVMLSCQRRLPMWGNRSEVQYQSQRSDARAKVQGTVRIRGRNEAETQKEQKLR